MNNFISVVVCTYNRQKYIGSCLDQLHNQAADKTLYEVIIVDNNSSDRTKEICHEAIQTNKNTSFRYITEPLQGLSYARNRGVRESRGNLIAFIDDDAFAGPEYISSIDHFFSQHQKVIAIGGRIIPQYEAEKPKWMSRFLLPLVAAQDFGDKVIPFRKGSFPIGANMAFRKTAFDTYGLFNTGLGRKGESLDGGEEKDFFGRLRSANEQIMYVPSVVVEHIIPENRVQPEYVKRQAIGIGRSERARVSGNGRMESVYKGFEECVKALGTIVLFFGYLLTGKPSAGWMLVRFRCWVINGLLFST